MSEPSFRRDRLSKPIFRWAQHVLPTLSETEREAIEAGDVWWDADLFGGNPDWAKLLAVPPATLCAEEQAFLDGPVDELCHMLDDWQINWELRDLPPEVWDFLKTHKFFAMIIPKSHGGLGFSAYAHSEVIRKLSTRSITGAVTAMVPNSLGPGELLHQFGTKAQQEYWLPRLADASEIPCFGLTSPEAGLRCRLDDQFRRGLPRHLARARGPRHQAQLAQALHHARADRDRDRACIQALRSRSPDRRPRRDRHHRRAGADEPARCRDRPPPSASVRVLPERSDHRAATSSFRSTTSSAASRRSARAGRC